MAENSSENATGAKLDTNYAFSLIDSAKELKTKWSTALTQFRTGDPPIQGIIKDFSSLFNETRECTTGEAGRGNFDAIEKIIDALTNLYNYLGRDMFTSCAINSFCIEYLRIGPLVKICCIKFFEPLTFYSSKPVDLADVSDIGNLLKHYMFSVYEVCNGNEVLRFRYYLESSNFGIDTYYVVGIGSPDKSYHAQVQPMGMHQCPNYKDIREVIGRDINQRVDKLEAGGSLF